MVQLTNLIGSISESDVDSVTALTDSLSSFSEWFVRVIQTGTLCVICLWIRVCWSRCVNFFPSFKKTCRFPLFCITSSFFYLITINSDWNPRSLLVMALEILQWLKSSAADSILQYTNNKASEDSDIYFLFYISSSTQRVIIVSVENDTLFLLL